MLASDGTWWQKSIMLPLPTVAPVSPGLDRQISASLTLPSHTEGSPPPRWCETSGRLLDDVAERKQSLFVERSPDQLQPERQTLTIEPGGNRNGWQSRHVHGHSKHVVQIHLDRVARGFFANPKGRRRRGRREDRVDAGLEAVLEVPLYQRANFLRPQVIGIVIACRQHIGADHDPTAHLLAETLASGLFVHIDDVAA